MVHLSDLDWNKSGEEALAEFKKGDVVKAMVLDVDKVKERISLGIKQLGGDPFAAAGAKKRGERVTCEITAVNENGIEVTVGDTGMSSFIRRSDLSRDRAEQRPERFSVGDKVDAQVTQIDKSSRKVNLSIKAMEMADEKEEVEL